MDGINRVRDYGDPNQNSSSIESENDDTLDMFLRLSTQNLLTGRGA